MSGYVKLKHEFTEELLLRAFTLVMIKILLLLFRLSDGCNKGKIKSVAIFLFKKDFEACGISEQSIINALKALVEANVIYEIYTTLIIKRKLTKVYGCAINFNYATWGIPYLFASENPKEKLNNLISLNLGLKSFQVAKMNNLKRCQNYLLYVENHTLLNHFIQVSVSFDSGECVPEKYFIHSTANGKRIILIGFENALYCEILEGLATKCPPKLVVLALFILDLQILYRIIALENWHLEPTLVKIIKSPAEAVNKVCVHWLETVTVNDKERLRNELEIGFNQMFEEYSDSYFDNYFDLSSEGYVSDKFLSGGEGDFHFDSY